MAMNTDNQNNDPLDDLFAAAKSTQDQLAETAEIGVESRLQRQLTKQQDGLWISALWRLCLSGGTLATCLAIWVLNQKTDSTITLTSIEKLIIGF